MQNAFIDSAVVTAIQGDYQAKARKYVATHSTTRSSIFARLERVWRASNREASLPITRTAVRGVPSVTHGVSRS